MHIFFLLYLQFRQFIITQLALHNFYTIYDHFFYAEQLFAFYGNLF